MSSLREAVEDTVEITWKKKYRISKKLHRYEKIPDDNNLNSQKDVHSEEASCKQMTKNRQKPEDYLLMMNQMSERCWHGRAGGQPGNTFATQLLYLAWLDPRFRGRNR